MIQPKISFGVKGRDVKQGEELEASWIWRDVEAERVGMREGNQREPKQTGHRTLQRCLPMTSIAAQDNVQRKAVCSLNSVCIGYLHLTLLVVRFPLPLLWACTPAYHAQSVHHN